jgi:selT/selW/selH-like putative selenoprotein
MATGLAAKIREEIGVEAELIRGDDGIFDVSVDGKRIYSKDETGRFPEPEEILSELSI